MKITYTSKIELSKERAEEIAKDLANGGKLYIQHLGFINTIKKNISNNFMGGKRAIGYASYLKTTAQFKEMLKRYRK